MYVRLFLLFLIILTPLHTSAAEVDRPFVVYDATQYANEPDLASYGVKPIAVIYADRKWFIPKIDADTWRAVAGDKRLTNSVPVVLDVETWWITGANEEQDKVSVNNYLNVLNIAKQAASGSRIGFYGVLPARGKLWSIVSKDPNLLAQWHSADQTLVPLGNAVDAIYLSLYTLNNDPEEWEEAAMAVITEARKYGKPIYGFLWPQFHEMNKQLGGQPIPAAFWARQLAFCRQNTDGIVLWGGYKQTWDPTAPWWKETQKFMQSQNLTQH